MVQSNDDTIDYTIAIRALDFIIVSRVCGCFFLLLTSYFLILA
jgi:hypothetical protein